MCYSLGLINAHLCFTTRKPKRSLMLAMKAKKYYSVTLSALTPA